MKPPLEPPDDPSPDETAQPPPAPPARGPMGSAGQPVAKPKDLTGSARRLLERIGPERAAMGGVVLVAVSSVVLTVIGPKILGSATDVIVSGVSPGSGGVDFGRLRTMLFVAIGLYIAASALAYAQAWTLAGVVQRTMRQLRNDIEAKLNRVPLSYVDGASRGDLLSRATNDIDNVAQSLQQTLGQILTSLLTLVGVLVMMFVISPLLALVAVVTVPLAIGLARVIAARSKPRFVQQWARTGTLNGQVEEAITGHMLVSAFNQQDEIGSEFDDTNNELYDSSYGAQFLSGVIQPAMSLLSNLDFVAIAVIGGLRVSAGAISIGDIQAFIQYSRQFSQPLTQVASMLNTVQSGLASAERVFELLDAEEVSADHDDAPVSLADTAVGRVEFDHVAFSYDPAKPLITDLSFVAEPGETIAIVGPSGAGKTTLVNLLMRFYELDGGSISVDGVDIDDVPRRDLRSKIGMVLQDTWLFGGTIRENIAYGRTDVTEAELLEAAEATYVDRFVRSLPDGYDTIIDDDAGNLSTGEKQLITIARAFVADPEILILDEATSSVDTRTEVLVQHAMDALRSERTSFVIAHRLSTIRYADEILVMDSGRIVEQGDHDELLARHGAYFDLYTAQFASPAVELADAQTNEQLPPMRSAPTGVR